MKAIGYVRVSTEEQARKDSLDVQERRIRDYCSARCWDLLRVVRDEGKSAKTVNRPGLKEITGRLKGFDVLVVCKLDRLTRTVKDFWDLYDEFKSCHVELAIIDESLDTTTALGRFYANIRVGVSQLERELIGERTKDVLQDHIKNGKVHSRPVYGYDAMNGRLVKNSQELAAIEQMHSWRADGVSYSGIAARLELEGIKTKRGGQWDSKTVYGILSRTTDRLTMVRDKGVVQNDNVG
jgi:site-specific DNA recombinase